MSTIENMRKRLAVLEPTTLEIIDESARHVGHEGAKSGGGHYQLRIVSPQFTGLSTIARHRLVYAALGPLMRSEVHALSIEARPPEQQHPSLINREVST